MSVGRCDMQATLPIANGILLWRSCPHHAFGSAAQDRFAGDCERPSLYRLDRLSVADAAQGLSALFDGAAVFL